MTTFATTIPGIDPATLRRLLRDGGELAIVDAREEGAFTGSGHLLYAASLPLSRLEVIADTLLPRRSVRLVVVDGDGTLAPRAAARLAALGYSDVSVLTGGTRAWVAAGFPVYSGAHVPSKAFAELVEHHDGTHWIDVATLRAKQQAGEDLVVLDTRSFPEFRAQTIPGAISVPGAEIVDAVRDLVPSPDTLVVASCGGRTRSIIGAQALIAAGLPNRVVSLQNGTMGWTLGGLAVEKGARRRSAPASAAARAWSVAAAAAVAERHGVPTVDAATLAAWDADATRTLHRIDVRQPEEYERGHRPGFVSVPSGQLVQETDRHVATLGARIVLADDGSLVRARLTASWLARMGWDVAVLDAPPPDGVLELGPRPTRVLGLEGLDEPADSLIAPEALAEWIDRGGVTLVDLGLSSEYRRGHLPGAWFSTRARLAASLDRLPKADALVLTSPDGAIARFAAAELRAQGVKALALDGGTRAWTAAGLPLDSEAHHADDVDDVWLPPRLQPDPETAMRAYLEWEIDLIHQVGIDPDFRFRDRAAASQPPAHHAAHHAA
ncbi:rhodanese-like domain-containing protein [Azospirillum melinis]